ncbi:MAG TPA: hypothetical protein VF744_14915 [Beijerinckiaceae bacterium]|jgi:hypothetical protein
MVVALYLIALAMIGAGAGAIAYGWGIVMTERGWTMVICAVVVLSAGLLLLGIAVVAGRIRRIERELAVFRDHLTRLGGSASPLPPRPSEPSPAAAGTAAKAGATSGVDSVVAPPESPIVGEEEHAVLRAADVIPEPVPPEPLRPVTAAPAKPAPAEPARTVAGTYSSGGNAYTMYSDGSIEAETPTGHYRFKSLEELKDFIASGGEDGTRPA